MGLEIIVYGAEQICASCVNLPSSKDTCEWLDAALQRKFPGQPFQVTYVDIMKEQQDEKKASFAKKEIEEDLFYPVVVIHDEIVGEGNPRLKAVIAAMEKHGYKPLTT